MTNVINDADVVTTYARVRELEGSGELLDESSEGGKAVVSGQDGFGSLLLEVELDGLLQKLDNSISKINSGRSEVLSLLN